MDEKDFQELAAKIGKEATEQIKSQMKKAEDEINAKADEKLKGYISQKDFEAFKQEKETEFTTKLQKFEDITKDQGKKINEMLEKGTPNSKSIEEFIIEQAPKIKELHEKGGYIEFSGEQLKAAGISSIGNTVVPMVSPGTNPYAPGIGNAPLSIFGLRYNPNFITSRIDLGRTNSPILAWANHLTDEGTPALVAEGAAKPLISETYRLEVSKAKKIAAYVVITEEFEQDLPAFATQVRRNLQDRVIRFWDDQIQLGVINAARPYEITALDDQITDANLYDGLRAMMSQIGYYNYDINGIAMNAIEYAKVEMGKGVDAHYLNPPFLNRISPLITQANKVALGFALAGDFNQYKVDIYKDFYLKMGWINDDLIKNQFVVVGELRYHDYISEARKKALCYHNLQYVANQIDGTPHS